ncbi:oxidoreductase [Allokutzneria sp. NRRL B-24872]|uniref:oxidoreductase n=1 Tax=Allokutzneria sp. NRRL B-24872 TaxID=1137961 RepID=UPI000A392EC2|nr:oxidoreductase [Allokutzneria sp. NRRL B-24872]
MDLDLKGKTAVVTGGSKGIGRAVTAALLAEGMSVVVASRTPGEPDALHVPADLTTVDGVEAVVGQAVEAFGGIDVLVNNVGGASTEMDVAGFAGISDERWQRTFELNLFSAIRMTRAALPLLKASKGSVVNVSSLSAQLPATSPADYSLAKAALRALTPALAEELAPAGVRVNTVTPGPTRTGFWEGPESVCGRLATQYEMEETVVRERMISTLGLRTGRLVEPSEVASVVAFLASPLAASISGADYLVDGGMLKSV